jgi:hypothetical protein
MLGTNDLEVTFELSAPEIAGGSSLLVAPPPLGAVTVHSELWSFGEGHDVSRQLGRLYRVVAEGRDLAFLDAVEIVTVSEVDGVHLDVEGHAALGRTVARVISESFAA